jgi:hypothetical protein
LGKRPDAIVVKGDWLAKAEGILGPNPGIVDRKLTAGVLEQADDVLCRREPAIAGVVLERDSR